MGKERFGPAGSGACGRGASAGTEPAHGAPEPSRPADGDGTAVDPVPGTTVDPGTAAASVEHEGETYHFCGQGCADAFVGGPEEHLGTPRE